MKVLMSAVSWFVASMFAITGLALLFSIPLAGIAQLLIAALFLPPVQRLVVQRFGKPIPRRAKLAGASALFIASIVITATHGGQSSLYHDMQIETRRNEMNAAHRDELQANRQAILASATSGLMAEQFGKVIASTQRYAAAGDPEINAVRAKATAGLKQQQDALRRQQIVAELKQVPAKDNKRNRALYGELVKLEPANASYASKLEYYDGKCAKEAEVERVATLRKKVAARHTSAQNDAIASQFSGWNGAHINLERFIKDNMNDPDSYKHVETRYWEKETYLVVETKFRGKNGFGGVVLNSVTAQVDFNGNVIAIIEQEP